MFTNSASEELTSNSARQIFIGTANFNKKYGIGNRAAMFEKKDLEKICQLFEDGYEEALEKIGFEIDPDLVKYEFAGGFNAQKI